MKSGTICMGRQFQSNSDPIYGQTILNTSKTNH